MEERKLFTLLDRNLKHYISDTPGQFGGYNKLKIYGKLDCPSALRYINKGQYIKYRVFLLMRKLQLLQDIGFVVYV